jgi:mono/diheme cytochrome c family protein
VTAATNAPPTGTTGGGNQTAAPNGKQLFASNCASCHTLKAAGATGTVGPNLDQLKPSEAVVDRQVTNGGGAMPAFKGTLTPAEITAVAKFVSSNAGK